MREVTLGALLAVAVSCGNREIPADLAACYAAARLEAERRPDGALVEKELRERCDRAHGH